MFPRTQPPRFPSRRQTGFGLVEIMVGMLIGMIGIVVMMQVFALAEGQKRNTTGGSDAQTNGAIAMYGLQRDLRQSGYGGIADLKVAGCDLALPSGLVLDPLAPITINHRQIPAGDANTDTLLIVFGNSNSSAQGDLVAQTTGSSTTYPMTNTSSFNVGDYVIAVPWGDDYKQSMGTPGLRPAQGTVCGLKLVRITTRDIASATQSITVSGSVSGGLVMSQNSVVYDMGPRPNLIAYAVRSGNLTACKLIDIDPATGTDNGKDCTSAGSTSDSTVWVPVASNIVSLRAQYGRNSIVLGATPTMDGVVDTYDQVTPPRQSTGGASPTTRCGWARIPAIRVAMTARNAQYDKTVVTSAAPPWIGTAGAPINLTATTSPSSDWQHYRYKVFETTVPLRNVTWIDATEVTQC